MDQGGSIWKGDIYRVRARLYGLGGYYMARGGYIGWGRGYMDQGGSIWTRGVYMLGMGLHGPGGYIG